MADLNGAPYHTPPQVFMLRKLCGHNKLHAKIRSKSLRIKLVLQADMILGQKAFLRLNKSFSPLLVQSSPVIVYNPPTST